LLFSSTPQQGIDLSKRQLASSPSAASPRSDITPAPIHDGETRRRDSREVDMLGTEKAARHSTLLAEETVPLKGWLSIFESHYAVPGSLTSSTVTLPRLSKSRPELHVNKQFCRDVAGGLLRINGSTLPSKAKFEEAAARRGREHTEEHLYRYATMLVSKIAYKDAGPGEGGGGAFAALICKVANQNLGIHLYEHVCKVFREQGSEEAVLQTGHHACNVSSEQGGLEKGETQPVVEITFEAVFQLVPFDFIDEPAKARMVFASVSVSLSRPRGGDVDSRSGGRDDGGEGKGSRNEERQETDSGVDKDEEEESCAAGQAEITREKGEGEGKAFDADGRVSYKVHRPVLPVMSTVGASPSGRFLQAAGASSQGRRKLKGSVRR
jgi:hypothetical protein